MKWFTAKTLDDLKALGSYREVRQSLQNHLGNRLSIKARSWQELWEIIQSLHNLAEKLVEYPEKNKSTETTLDEQSLYFKSEAARIIYALIELDEKYKLKELGVNLSHYRDSDKAKQWRNKIAKIIHPDVCQHTQAALATTKLNELFANMIGKK